MNQVQQGSLKVQHFFSRYAQLSKNHYHEPSLLSWFENHTQRGADLSDNPDYDRVNQQLIHLSSNDDNIISAFFASNITGEYFRENNITGVGIEVADGEYYANKRPWFIATLKKGVMNTRSPSADFSTGRTSSAIEGPVRNGSGKLIGVAGIDLNLAAINKVIDNIQYENQGFAFLLDNKANIVHLPKRGKLNNFKITTKAIDFDGDSISDESGKPVIVTTSIKVNHPIKAFDSQPQTNGFAQFSTHLQAQGDGLSKVEFMGESYSLTFKAIKLESPQMNWTIGLMVPTKQVKGPVWRLQFYTLAGVVALIGLLLSMIFFVCAPKD